MPSKPDLDKILSKDCLWLVTGCAGFIGSHLTKTLLEHNQRVVGLDNLYACGTKNLEHTLSFLPDEIKQKFHFIEGDITDPNTCHKACADVDFVLHQAAICSVPYSFEAPVFTNRVNVGGFLNVLNAAGVNRVKAFVYASSSAVYGDYTQEPNQEDQCPQPLSPYAVGKYTNELYAKALAKHYGLKSIGLRYFNIYGSRQDPSGAYAAVIPKWAHLMKSGEPVEIYGNGFSTRDFCHVSDAVQANILAALSTSENPLHAVYNVASGLKVSLKDLYESLQDILGYDEKPVYRAERPGDICISCANIDKIQKELGFFPQYDLKQGLDEAVSCIR